MSALLCAVHSNQDSFLLLKCMSQGHLGNSQDKAKLRPHPAQIQAVVLLAQKLSFLWGPLKSSSVHAWQFKHSHWEICAPKWAASPECRYHQSWRAVGAGWIFPWILEGLRLFGPDLCTAGSSLNLTLHLFLRLYFGVLQTVCMAEKYK